MDGLEAPWSVQNRIRAIPAPTGFMGDAIGASWARESCYKFSKTNRDRTT